MNYELPPPLYPVACKRCGAVWYPKTPSSMPRTCPKCKSPYWDRERSLKHAGAPPAKFRGIEKEVTAPETKEVKVLVTDNGEKINYNDEDMWSDLV